MAAAGACARLMPSAGSVQQNKIVFCSYHGAGYGCNPKYVTEALLEHSSLDLDLVWLTKKQDPSIPARVRQVRYGTPKAAFELATAKVWVDNSRVRRYVRKKPDQFYLQTWHGCLSPKRLEADIEPFLSKAYIKGAKQDSQDADLLICNNDFFEGVMRNSFWYEGPILRCGLPRNAPLITPNEELRRRVRASLGMSDKVGLCLYAPTFRDNGDNSVFHFDYARCCEALKKRFGKDFVFALRLHPVVAQTGIGKGAGLFDLSSYSDPIELLCAADVCITDYSSMAEDFALLGRPGYLYMPDAEQFSTSRGGLYYPHDVRPYPAAYTEDELIARIFSTPDEEFKVLREAFFDMVGLCDDGKGAQQVAEILEHVVAGKTLPFLNS